jgi:hypothetical protein
MLIEIGVIKRRLKELGVPRHLVEKHIERVTRGDRSIERSRAAADQLVNGYLKMPFARSDNQGEVPKIQSGLFRPLCHLERPAGKQEEESWIRDLSSKCVGMEE